MEEAKFFYLLREKLYLRAFFGDSGKQFEYKYKGK
jgi:hypothetical protein